MTLSIDAPADDPSKVVATDTPSHRADAGLAWGTLIHGLLEHAMRHRDATHTDLYRLATWLAVEEPQLRTVLDEAVKTVLEVSKADFWQRAVPCEHSVETPFMYRPGDHEIVSGVVDLMFRDKGIWSIVDYKTDIEPTNLSASYLEQLKLYERALASVGIREVQSQIQSIRSKHTAP
jgi:ATP-dependent exoDNAse (exonuclease V) beta subunit